MEIQRSEKFSKFVIQGVSIYMEIQKGKILNQIVSIYMEIEGGQKFQTFVSKLYQFFPTSDTAPDFKRLYPNCIKFTYF